jgi:hypothetical protein
METQWLEPLHHPSGHDFELHLFSADTAFYLTLFLEGKKVGYARSTLEETAWTRSDLKLEVTGKIAPKTIDNTFYITLLLEGKKVGYARFNLEGTTWILSDLKLEVTGKIAPKTIWQHLKPPKPFLLHGKVWEPFYFAAPSKKQRLEGAVKWWVWSQGKTRSSGTNILVLLFWKLEGASLLLRLC